MCPIPSIKFLALPVPALVVGEKNLVIGFGPPHFRSASAIAGFSWFYRIVSQNFTTSANQPALLFILLPLVETEPAENITVVMETA